jgi:sucrose phosphorylase
VVRLWRAVLDAVAPGTLLITETNLPQAENLAYFGDGSDEAHLVYQFPLPPLVLAAFHRGSAQMLHDRLATLPTPAAGTGVLHVPGLA